MQISTYKLAEIVAIEMFLKEEPYSTEKLNETINYFLEYVDIIGEDNYHLRNSLNLDIYFINEYDGLKYNHKK